MLEHPILWEIEDILSLYYERKPILDEEGEERKIALPNIKEIRGTRGSNLNSGDLQAQVPIKELFLPERREVGELITKNLG